MTGTRAQRGAALGLVAALSLAAVATSAAQDNATTSRSTTAAERTTDDAGFDQFAAGTESGTVQEAYREFRDETREAEADLASGEIDREEYNAEVREAEANYREAVGQQWRDYSYDPGFEGQGYYDRYGYFDGGYDWTADDEEGWFNDADWF